MASKNSHRSPKLALLLLACVGALGQERQLSVSTPSPGTNRLAPSTSASAYLEVVGKGPDFLANLMNAELDLLPEYRGANVYWLFHRVYKLALAMIAAERLSAAADLPGGLLDRLLGLQADSGGWITDYNASGERIGQANVETTCLAILGLEAVNRRAVPAAAPVAALASHLPAFRYHGVVLEASQLKYRPHDDVIYPAVVRGDGRIPNAPGKLLFEDDGRLCLFFNIGPRLRNKIALAISESR